MAKTKPGDSPPSRPIRMRQSIRRNGKVRAGVSVRAECGLSLHAPPSKPHGDALVHAHRLAIFVEHDHVCVLPVGRKLYDLLQLVSCPFIVLRGGENLLRGV